MGKKISIEKKWIALSQQPPLEEQSTQRKVIEGLKSIKYILTKWLDTEIYGYNILHDPEQRDYCTLCPQCKKNQLDSGLYNSIQCSNCFNWFNIENSKDRISTTVPIRNNKCNCDYFTSKICSLVTKSSTISLINPTSIKSLILSINKDTIYTNEAVYNKDTDMIDYNRFMKNSIIPFFSYKSRLIEKGLIFTIENIEIKVIGTIPEVKGKVSISTRIQCIDYYTNKTMLQRALLITKNRNESIDINCIKADILSSPAEQLVLKKGNEVLIGRHQLYIRNCIPECGMISSETILSIEQKNIKSITKIKMAVIKHNHQSTTTTFTDQLSKKDYEKYIIEEYYKPYFLSGVSKYIERGDLIKIEDIELFVLNSYPENGYINANTLLWLKFNKTKEQCLAQIDQADNKLAMGLMMDDNNSNSNSNTVLPRFEAYSDIRRERSEIRLRILGEYLFTREILNSVPENIIIDDLHDIQTISQNEIVNQQRMTKIQTSLPIFEVNTKYLNSMKQSNDDINTKCVICMEDYIIEDKATTLPCCKNINVF